MINLQRCDDSAAQEIRKMAPAGSLLDAERDCVIIVNKIGSMIGESTYETGLSIPATTWFQIKNVVSALGDCSAGRISIALKKLPPNFLMLGVL